ncbi:MAG: dienelactone hydrolase family protein [Pseudomonadota bacterium]
MSRIGGVVLIHGRGASPRSMLPLLAPLGLEGLPLEAPAAPGGSWWPTSFLAPMAEMAAPIADGLAAVDAAVAEIGMPRSHVALVGFSQGACLTLEYAARQGAGLGAVIGFSGGLVGTSDDGAPDPALYGHGGKAFDYENDLSGTQVLITCHEQDPHIPLKRAQASASVLTALGADARLIEHPGGGHQPMPNGIVAARAILGT